MADLSMFPEDIIEMIGQERFSQSRRVEWDQKWLGNTDYIDRPKADDFKDNHHIYYGVDCYKRPFILLKVRATKPSGVQKEFMINIFQRYTGDTLFVACCSQLEGEALLKGGCAIGSELTNDISKFLENKFVEGNENYGVTRLEIFYNT